MALTRAEIWRVASAERSASRCTSSATTAKPPPPSPPHAPPAPPPAPRPRGAPAARPAGGGRLYRGIEGQHVGLLGDVGDQFGDFTDLLRGFAQALDALGGVL